MFSSHKWMEKKKQLLNKYGQVDSNSGDISIEYFFINFIYLLGQKKKILIDVDEYFIVRYWCKKCIN